MSCDGSDVRASTRVSSQVECFCVRVSVLAGIIRASQLTKGRGFVVEGVDCVMFERTSNLAKRLTNWNGSIVRECFGEAVEEASETE